MSNLNNLYSSIHPLHTLHTDIRLHKPIHDSVPSRFLETKDALARLVEALDERDVKVGYIGSDAEIYVGEGPFVRAIDFDAATGVRPSSAVGWVGGFGDVGACGVWALVGVWGVEMEGKRVRTWVDPLTCSFSERVTAPCGFEESEVSGREACKSHEWKEGEHVAS
jgi:hypothetical protein